MTPSEIRLEKTGVCLSCHAPIRWTSDKPHQRCAACAEAQKAEHRKKYLASDKGKDRLRTALKKYLHKRRAQMRNAEISLTEQQWGAAVEHFGGKCAYCGTPLDRLTQDHFKPVSLGGGYAADNIVPACKPCNSTKHNADPLMWCFSTGRMVQYALAADYLGAPR